MVNLQSPKVSFDEFFNAYLASNPQAAAYLAFDPGARRRAFQELRNERAY